MRAWPAESPLHGVAPPCFAGTFFFDASCMPLSGIAPGTHRMPRKEALRAVESAEIKMRPVPLEIGDRTDSRSIQFPCHLGVANGRPTEHHALSSRRLIASLSAG